MKLMKLFGSWMLLTTAWETTGFVVAGSLVHCNAPSVMAGQAASLTCFFNHDLKQKNTDFAVQHSNRQGQLSEILSCVWITTDRPSCTTRPGYVFDGIRTSNVTVTIPSATQQHVGSYLCLPVPSDVSDSIPCDFNLNETASTTEQTSPSPTVYSVPTTEENTTTQDDEQEDNNVNVIAIVIPVVILVPSIVTVIIIIIVCRQRLRSRFRECKIRKRNTRSSPIHDDNQPIESYPLVSVTSPRMVSTETTDNTGRDTRAELSQHETITAKFCELTREEIISKFCKYIYNRAVQLLLTTGAVVITGPERCGKSTLGRAVLDRLSEMGFYPLVLDHPNRWKEKRQSSKKHVVLLDECDMDEWSTKSIASMPRDEGCYIIFVLKSDAMNSECSGLAACLSTTPTIDLGKIVPSNTREITPLLEACECDDLDKVITILSGGVEPNGTNREGKTPLHIACEHVQADIVSQLLWAECDVNSKDKASRTPLHYACKDRAQNSGANAVSAYEDLSPRPESNDTPRETIVKDLLASGASLEVADDKGRTPLHVACERRSHALVNILLQAGANVRAIDERGYTPLHLTCAHNKRTITETLIDAKSDVDASDNDGHTPLHVACVNKANDSVEILLRAKANVNARTNTDKTPLHMACESNNCALVNILLQAGANVKAKDNKGFTPLHVACKKKAKESAEILLRANASVEARTDSGNTPLHMACNAGNKDIVIMLLDKGADTGVTNNKGQTPDELARAKDHVDIAFTVRTKREKSLAMHSAVGE